MSYPKIHAVTHRECAELFFDEVLVQEKIDGSQFRFIKRADGGLQFFSHNREQSADGADSLFKPSIEAVKERADLLTADVLYCGEALAKPKHNVLAYERAPEGHVCLFDALDRTTGEWISYEALFEEAFRCRLGVVPVLARGKFGDAHELQSLLATPSILGGMIEGVVVKNYTRNVFGKLVADQFREVAGRKIPKPKDGSFDSLILSIANKVAVPARLMKQLQHMKEDGKLTDSPNDIGPLIKALMADVEAECSDVIKDELFKTAVPLLNKKLGPIMACWYKERLAKLGGASEKWGEES